MAEANQRITEVAEFWIAEDYHVSRSPLRGLVIALVPYPDLGFGTRSDYSPGEYIRIAVRDVPHPTVLGALGHEVSARSK